MGKTLWNVAEAGLVPCPSQSFRTFAANEISLIFREFSVEILGLNELNFVPSGGMVDSSMVLRCRAR